MFKDKLYDTTRAYSFPTRTAFFLTLLFLFLLYSPPRSNINRLQNPTHFNDILLVVNWNHADRFKTNFDRFTKLYSPFFPNIVHYSPAFPTDLGLEGTADVVVNPLTGAPKHLTYHSVWHAMKTNPQYKGYLHTHFDVFLNPYRLATFNKSQIWYYDTSIIEHEHPRGICQAGPYRVTDKKFTFTEKRVWPHWGKRAPCARALDDVPRRLLKRMQERLGWGDERYCFGCWADAVYLPAWKLEEFTELVRAFWKHEVFLELAWPTMVNLMATDEDPIVPMQGHFTFGEGLFCPDGLRQRLRQNFNSMDQVRWPVDISDGWY